MALQGKGFYIWQISRCEAGNVGKIASVASQAGLSHVLIKIADGTHEYNVTSAGVDLVPPLVQALASVNISAWGWHYVYGYEPLAEADIAINRLQQLNLDGYVIDAEAQYKEPGKDIAAQQFMSRLRTQLPNFPIALSSYRYPSYHPTFPFQEFLEKCDLNMPQVYWVGAHNPGEQLVRSLREFQALTPFRPIFPTGAAYKEGDWAPTVADINEFLTTAQELNMNGANFWEWGHTRQYLPHLWEAVAAYTWEPDDSNLDIAQRYILALNTHSPTKVVALYNSNAVHVTQSRSLKGVQAIKSWYSGLFNTLLPKATFQLVEYSSQPDSRQLYWTALSSAGNVNDGYDTFGLLNGKITYHYTSFTIT